MDYHLLQRQLGGTAGCGDAYTHALVRRLHNTQDVSTAAANSAVAWDDRGILLACAGEDCTLMLWDADRGVLAYRFEPGHTEPIICTGFLPATGSRLLVSAGPSQDIRMTDLERQATRPYTTVSSVKTLLPISSAVFAAGGEDGLLRCFDSREREAVGTQQSDQRNVLVDQGAEGLSSSGRVSILSMSQDPLSRQYIATGGSDAYVRVYDVRMMRPPSCNMWRNFTSEPTWCYCLAPMQFRQRSTGHGCQVSSVAFDQNGQRLLAGYAGKDIYSFDVRQHACSYEQINSRQYQRRSSVRRGSRARRSASAGVPAATLGERPVLTPAEVAGARAMQAALFGTSRPMQQAEDQRQQQSSAAGTAAAAEGTAAAARAPRRHVRHSRSRLQTQQTAARQSVMQSPGETLHAAATDPEPSRVRQDEQHQEPAAGPSSSGGDSDSDNSISSGSEEEVLLAAEVHLLGPDGTVLHTTRIPLQRAPRAAAEAILRGGNLQVPAGAANGSGHQQQQERVQRGEVDADDRPVPQQEGLRLPSTQEPRPGPLPLLPTSLMQRMQQSAQAAEHQIRQMQAAAQERQRALDELQQLQQRAEVLRAEQERLTRLRDSLARLGPGQAAEGGPAGVQQQGTDNPTAAAAAAVQQAAEEVQPAQRLVDTAEQAPSLATTGNAASQPQDSDAAGASTSQAAGEGGQSPTQQQPVPPAQHGFLAQLHATAAGFAVPQQQSGPSPSVAVPRQIPVIDVGGSSIGVDGRSSTCTGRRSRRPRRSSRTVIPEVIQPATVDTHSAVPSAADGQQQVSAARATSPSQHSTSSSEDSFSEEEEEEAAAAAAGSNGVGLHTAGSNMAFMGLGGSDAGSSRNIGNISPSVVAEGAAAAAFIHGREPAAAPSARHRSRLQQQEAGEQQANAAASSDSDMPALKRRRVAGSPAAGGRDAPPAQQQQHIELELPFGSLLTGEQQPQNTAPVPAPEPAPTAEAANAGLTTEAPNARLTTVATQTTSGAAVLDESGAEATAHPLPSGSLRAAAALPGTQEGTEQQQAAHQQQQVPHEGEQQQQEQWRVLRMRARPPSPPALSSLDHQQPRAGAGQQPQHQQQRQPQRQQREEEAPGAGLNLLFGALMSNIGQALAAAGDGEEIEVQIPIGPHAADPPMSQAGRSRTPAVHTTAHAAAAAVGGVDPNGGSGPAAVDRPEGAAAMLRAELGLPRITRAQALRQVHTWQQLRIGRAGNRQHRRQRGQQQVQQGSVAGDPAVVTADLAAGTAGATQAAPDPQQQQQQPSDGVEGMDVDQQQPEAPQQQEQPQGSQQQRSLEVPQQQQQPQRRQGVKRKRSERTEQQLQQGTASTSAAAASTPPAAGSTAAVAAAAEAELPAGSDAAFVAALSGRRSGRRQRTSEQTGQAAAPASLRPAAAAAAEAAPGAGHHGSTALRRSTRRSRGRLTAATAQQQQQNSNSTGRAVVSAAATTEGVSTRSRQQQAQPRAPAAAAAAARSPRGGGDSSGGSEMPDLMDPDSDEIEQMQLEVEISTSVYDTGLTSFSEDYEDASQVGGAAVAAAGTSHMQREQARFPESRGYIRAPYQYRSLEDDVAEENHFGMDFWDAAAAAAEGGADSESDAASDSESDADDHISRGYSCCYSGHRNLLSSRNAAWLGSRGEYVVSGSDDGCLFVWDASSGDVVNVVKGGDKSIRRVQVNPKQQLLLATCGPEPIVRLWSPTADTPADPAETAAAVQHNRRAAAVDDAFGRVVNHGFINLLSRWAERVMGGVIGAPGLGEGGGRGRGAVLRPLETATRTAAPRMPRVMTAEEMLAAAAEERAPGTGGPNEDRVRGAASGAATGEVHAQSRRRYQTRSATAAAAAEIIQGRLRAQQWFEAQRAQQQQPEDSDEPPPLETDNER